MESRSRLSGGAIVTKTDAWGERIPTLALVETARGEQRITHGVDTSYETDGRVDGRRERKVTPQVTQNSVGRRGAIDGRTRTTPDVPSGRSGWSRSRRASPARGSGGQGDDPGPRSTSRRRPRLHADRPRPQARCAPGRRRSLGRDAPETSPGRPGRRADGSRISKRRASPA